MTVCAACGRESPDHFGFCPACGAPLAAAAAPREVRKVVTVLFCDLTGSTAIGDRLDPEPLRALMTRYYDSARSILERHGGTVEKFVGDAVMAVFGIPSATEDDALRAVRAAVELRERVHALGLEARIGVNTGEVVAGEGDTLVTGDAVNVTARLEQAAAPGEILLGVDTLRLVRDAVDVERIELALKGKPEPVPAFRLERLDAGAAGLARRLDRQLVGRERERERLRADFEDAVAARTCRLFTLVGPAGIGKSRLVADFLEHVDGAAVVAAGRALSYGEGITYWPLVEMLLQLGIAPEEALRSSPADTQLATRALLERVAADRPLVLVLDDLQWAEAPLLDLVEHVADWSREAPILLLCVARPELLDVRPGWGGGKLNATSVLLEPLAEEQASRLVDDLLGDVALDDEVRDRIVATSEGNPLFLEEMTALARDAGGAADVPPTIHALLQARLDTLTDQERTVIERGAVEGKLFHRGAVTALCPEPLRDDVAGRLLALVRKELVRPDLPQIPGDDAFRFRHLLIRDTAYESLPKAVRADLHEQFAAWLDEHGDLLEQDELVGYHLEQAARNLAELEAGDPRARELGERAAARLGAAGRAAYARGDLHGARSLLSRSVALLPEGPARRRLLPDLVDALLEASGETGVEELAAELERGDELDRARALALRLMFAPIPGEPVAETADGLKAARAALEREGDVLGVARCERALGMLAWGAGRAGEAGAAYARVYELVRGQRVAPIQRDAMDMMMVAAVFGGARADDVRALLARLREDADAGGPLLVAAVETAVARVNFGSGVIDRTQLEETIEHQVRLLRETGSLVGVLWARNYLIIASWLEGDAVEVVRLARETVEEHERVGAAARMFLANAIGRLAVAHCRVGDPDAALEAVARGREIAHEDDVADQMELDAGEAFARALRGEADEAERLLERAHRAVAEIDMSILVDDLLYTEAGARQALGDVDAARDLLVRLAQNAEARGLHRFAARYRRDLEALA